MRLGKRRSIAQARAMLRLFLTLPILLTACLKDETVSGFADPGAAYRLTEIADAPFAGHATVTFPAPGEIQGETPCNSYTARQTVPYPWFRAERITTSRRVCPDLSAETEFLDALRTMTLADIAGPVLILSNDDGVEMVFRAD